MCGKWTTSSAGKAALIKLIILINKFNKNGGIFICFFQINRSRYVAWDSSDERVAFIKNTNYSAYDWCVNTYELFVYDLKKKTVIFGIIFFLENKSTTNVPCQKDIQF